MIMDQIIACLTWGAVFSSLVCVCVLLWNLRGVRDLARRHMAEQPYLAASVTTLSWVSSVTLTAVVVLTAAYTAKLYLVAPKVHNYPVLALGMDLVVYLVLISALLIPTWLLVWRKRRLKEKDYAGPIH
jgi:uncharacterized membrane protein YbhN (UPF0104 family)